MPDIREAALNSKAWPFEEARKLLNRFRDGPPKKGYVLFETGYAPSGLPHMGTFGEIARTTMVRHAFEAISDIPTRMICFSDDMDGLRKVPDNVPNPDALAEHLQKPLTAIPDPFGTHESFGHHNNAMLQRFLDEFQFHYEFISATEFYKSGRFDNTLRLVAERYDDIQKVMLATLGDERRESYSCFLPIHPETGQILYVPMKQVDAAEGTVTFDDESGREWTLPVTGGNVKLQWKPDFGARWAALDVDFEMFGKDHSSNAPIYDRICGILGGKKPDHYVFELFLDENGQKISKSKGNGLTIDEWLTYAPAESLAYYQFLKPRTAKKLHWDVIPKAMDEYHQHLRAFETQDPDQRLANPVWHIHAGRPPESTLTVSFAMLLNLVSASAAENKEHLWGFIRRHAPDTTPETHPDLDAAADFATRYFNDHVKPTRQFRAATEVERKAILDLRSRLAAWDGEADPEALQSLTFAVGKSHNFEPLRDWFKALYEVLLGTSNGPRFGGFAALYGVDETIALIDEKIDAKDRNPV